MLSSPPLSCVWVYVCGWVLLVCPQLTLVLQHAELLSAVEAHHALSWPFLKPVDQGIALDYYEVIKDPMDLSLMRSRLGNKQYYVNLEMFVADMRKMCDNCRCVDGQSMGVWGLRVTVCWAAEELRGVPASVVRVLQAETERCYIAATVGGVVVCCLQVLQHAFIRLLPDRQQASGLRGPVHCQHSGCCQLSQPGHGAWCVCFTLYSSCALVFGGGELLEYT